EALEERRSVGILAKLLEPSRVAVELAVAADHDAHVLDLRRGFPRDLRHSAPPLLDKGSGHGVRTEWDLSRLRTPCLDLASMYAQRRQPSKRTRERIMAAVRALLEEGRFHESTVEEVAARPGVGRATRFPHCR